MTTATHGDAVIVLSSVFVTTQNTDQKNFKYGHFLGFTESKSGTDRVSQVFKGIYFWKRTSLYAL